MRGELMSLLQVLGVFYIYKNARNIHMNVHSCHVHMCSTCACVCVCVSVHACVCACIASII